LRRGWIAAAGIFFILFASVGYLSIKLPLLDALGPGPGFFPLILALIGGLLAAVLIGQIARQRDGAIGVADVGAPASDAAPDVAESLIPDQPAQFRMMGIVILMAAAFMVLDPLGYRLTALLFITLLLLVLGVRNILAIACVALVFSFGVFHSFYYWLKVPLPIGGFGL
jgi:putative tricarboxylic transport membrane protein